MTWKQGHDYGPHDESGHAQVVDITLGSRRPGGPGGPYREVTVAVPEAIKRQRRALNGKAYADAQTRRTSQANQ